MRVLLFLKLPGPYTQVAAAPKVCASCASKHLYVQADFKRSLGLTMVSLASLVTIVFAYLGYGWFVIWSPFFVALIIDRSLARSTSLAVVCYACEHIHRGLDKALAEESFEGFDLELHDRLLYAEKEKTET